MTEPVTEAGVAAAPRGATYDDHIAKLFTIATVV